MVSEVYALVELMSPNSRQLGLGIRSEGQKDVLKVSVELAELAPGVKAGCEGRCLRGLLLESLTDLQLRLDCLFHRDLAVVVHQALRDRGLKHRVSFGSPRLATSS